jgi:amino acid adenylation domain-containing protein
LTLFTNPTAGPTLPAAPERLEQLVAARAARSPEAHALSDGEITLTYAALDAESAHLADELAALDVRPGAVVGISMARTVLLPLTVLAILRAGGAYLALDRSYPDERLAYMIHASGAGLVLVDDDLRPSWLPAHVRSETVRRTPTRRLERSTDGPARPAAGCPESAAYVVFTSGSTGRPKGIVMPHRTITRLVRWQATQAGLGVAARTLQYAPIGFDVATQEIFSTWFGGGCLVMVDDTTRRGPFDLLRHVERCRVERLFLPFVALDMLCQAICRRRPTGLAVRDVVTAGERLRITAAIRTAFDRNLNARLHNHYGPSETHLVCAHTLHPPAADWPQLPPIGRLITGARAVVLGPDGREVPNGTIGELFVGGTVLATGYVNRPGLTAERFVPLPGIGRAYRTGDQVRLDAAGLFEFIGRTDDQVKIRGHRIEPGEVEATIASVDGIRQVAVVVRPNTADGPELVAYVVTDETVGPALSAAVRRRCAERLPTFMVPRHVEFVPELPMTPTGKVDRQRLTGHPPEPSQVRVR